MLHNFKVPTANSWNNFACKSIAETIKAFNIISVSTHSKATARLCSLQLTCQLLVAHFVYIVFVYCPNMFCANVCAWECEWEWFYASGLCTFPFDLRFFSGRDQKLFFIAKKKTNGFRMNNVSTQSGWKFQSRQHLSRRTLFHALWIIPIFVYRAIKHLVQQNIQKHRRLHKFTIHISTNWLQ